MALSSGALTTVAKVIQYLGDGLPGITVYHDAGAASTAATSQVTDTQWIGIVTTGANAGTHTKTFSAATDDTLGELVTTINALAKGYVASLEGDDTINSDWLIPRPTTNIWGIGSKITLYYADYDLVERLIEAASDQIESWLDRKFASQDFSEIGSFNRTTGLIQLRNPNVQAVDFLSVDLHDAMSIYYSGAAKLATVEVRADSLVQRTTTGDPASTATETESDLTDAANDTVAELAGVADAVGGWTASSITNGPSQYLDLKPTIATKGPGKGSSFTEVTLQAWTQYDDDYILHAAEGYIEVATAFHGFTNLPPRFRCDYTAGFDTVPYDVEQVVIELTAEMFKASKIDTNLKSERLGDYAYELADATSGSSSRRASWVDRLSAHRKMVI